MLKHKIHLQSKSWYQHSNVYAKGFVIDESGIYTKERLCIKVLECIDNPNQFISGEFAAIIIEEEQVRLIADTIRSTPIFYTVNGNQLHISDECSSLRNEELGISLNRDAVTSFLYSGYVHSNYTLNKDVFQVEAGTIVSIKHGKKEIFDYAKPQDVNLQHQSSGDLLKVLSDVFDDYIEVINGREVVVSLSGGYDSRLVLAMFYLKKYDRVSCFSYGRPSLVELENAKLVSKKLGYNWQFINYDDIFDGSLLESDSFQDYCRYASNDTSVFFCKQYFPAAHLKSNKRMDSNAVIIAGHTGDVLSGGHLSASMSTNRFSTDKFIHHVIKRHFHFHSYKSDLFNILSKSMEIDTSIHPWIAYESWERKNRQSKFIVNSNRAFNYFGYSTLMPLWDRRIIEFFKKLPFEQKYRSKLYRDTLRELVFEPLGINTINETQPSRSQLIKQKVKDQIKMVFPKSVTNQFIDYSDPFYYQEVIKLMESTGFTFVTPRQKNIWNAYLPQWYLHKEFKLNHSDIVHIINK